MLLSRRFENFNLFFPFALILLLFGCDPCNYEQVNVISEGDVYFSALPANSSTPSIFQIDLTTNTTNEIVKNGILYSPPSLDKKIVFIRNNLSGGQDVILSNIDGTKQRVIASGFSWNSREFAIISSNGKSIAIGADTKELWLFRNEIKAFRLSSNLCPGTIPAFSPDGSKIAFYEGTDLYSPMNITTYFVDTESPVFLGTFPLDGTAIELYGDVSLSWSSDSRFIFFPRYSLINGDVLHILSYDFKTQRSFVVTVSGCFYAIPSSDFHYAFLTGRDGILWRRDLTDTIYPKVKVIAPSYGVSYNIYPQLSPDETKIIYTRYYRDEKVPFRGILELANLNDSSRGPKILVNNVFRGFWNRKY
ncbi:MAG: TolB family protein [Candidatus Kapaibacteriales bacterium]